MNIKERIDMMVRLGEYFVMNDEAFQSVKEKARIENPWFSIEFINLAIENIARNFLQKSLLQAWADAYAFNNNPSTQ